MTRGLEIYHIKCVCKHNLFATFKVSMSQDSYCQTFEVPPVMWKTLFSVCFEITE